MLTMLPTLKKLQIGVGGPLKRQKMDDELPPCHDEFRYDDGEIVNLNSDRRVQGASSKFLRNAPFSLETALTTYDDMIALNPLVSCNWETVLRELYSRKTAQPPEEPLEGEAFVQSSDNNANPQYYLKIIETATTLSHIQPDGRFWARGENNPTNPVVGDKCYTNGFLWTNPMPSWSWKNRMSNRFVRVRVDIPAKTQVVIDRAPVFGSVMECQFDDHHISIIPDVLLSSAEFLVTSVVHYRSKENEYKDANEFQDIQYVKPRERGIPTNDLEYASLRVFDSPEFMDVRVAMVAQLELPSVESFDKPLFI